MILTDDVKNLIIKEYNEFKDQMYAGKSKKERDELAQFFTPPEISIKLIEELSDLKGNILDPTSGSGNLLAAALIAGADSDKIFGNDYDYTMVVLCRDRLNRVCKMLGKPGIQDWQIHRGNVLIGECLTCFGPEYDNTILAELLKKRRGLKGGWLANPEGYLKYKENQAKYGKEHADKLEEVTNTAKAEYEDIWDD